MRNQKKQKPAPVAVSDFDELYPNRFMKAGEFKGKPVTLTISRVEREDLGEDGQEKPKAVISFERTEKQFVMNRTNGVCLRQMFTRDVSKWIGRRVTLHPVQITDPFTGMPILAIRVKGSPDIAEDMVFAERIGRQEVTFRLARTVTGKGAAKPPPPPVAPPEPAEEDEDASPFGTTGDEAFAP